MGSKTKKEIGTLLRPMKNRDIFIFLLSILTLFSASSCSSKPKPSILVRDYYAPPRVIQEAFAREGKSDYLLLFHEGYSFRLLYLCENRVLNYLDEPKNNPVLVSIQPILDTEVEKKLSADDRRRIWACLERKVWEEHSRVEESKNRLSRERMHLEREISSIKAQKAKILEDMAEKKRIEEERQRRLEQERRRAEEERQRKIAEDQKKIAEEERKLKYYRTGAKEGHTPLPPPPAPGPKITESGIFMAMKEAQIFEEPRESSKISEKSSKYEIFDVINSTKDQAGRQWYQIYVGERVIAEMGKKVGWSPEENHTGSKTDSWPGFTQEKLQI